jgi:O-antigen/teichoic acid export membrane protein
LNILPIHSKKPEHFQAMTSPGSNILSKMTFLTAANLLAAILGFIAVRLIARHYGAGPLGQISLALSLVAQASLVTHFGSDLYGVKQITSGNASSSEVAGTVILLRFIVACFTFTALLALPLIAPQNVSIQGMYLSLVIIATVLAMDLWAIATSRIVAETIAVAVLFFWVSRNLSTVDFDHHFRDAARFARASAPITGTQLLRGLCFSSDIIILGLLVSSANLGRYVVAYQVFLFAISLSSAYFVILLPRISAHANSKTNAMALELRRSLVTSVPLALIGAGMLAVLARPILVMLFDPAYGQASTSLRILCIALVLNLLNRHYRQVLIARNRQHRDMALTAAGAVVHIGSKIVLIPVLGIAGAAVGSVMGELFLVIALRRAALANPKATG